MVQHTPLVRPFGVQFPRIGEFERPAEADHLRQIVGAAVFDDLPRIVIADKAGSFAADTDIAV